MIFIKIHDTENGKILAMCDEKLIDEILSEDELVINIKNYQDFYSGELIDQHENLSSRISLKEIFSANIIGEEAVALGIRNKIIKKEHIKLINKIPYAHAYKI